MLFSVYELKRKNSFMSAKNVVYLPTVLAGHPDF